MLFCFLQIPKNLINLDDLQPSLGVATVVQQSLLEHLKGWVVFPHDQEDVTEVEQTFDVVGLLFQDLLVQGLGLGEVLLVVVADGHVVVDTGVEALDGGGFGVIADGLVILAQEVVAVGDHAVGFQGLLDVQRLLQTFDGALEVLQVDHAQADLPVDDC